MDVWMDSLSAECRGLLDDLRSRKVSQPTSIDFRTESWKARAERAISEDTQRLLELGAEVYATLDALRAKLAILLEDHRVEHHRGHAVLLYANALDLFFGGKSQGGPKDDGPLIPDFIAAEKIEGVSMNLRPTLVNLAESIYDSLRYPVSYFAKDSLDRYVKVPHARVFEWAGEVHQIACRYASCEYVWSRVLWGEARITGNYPTWSLHSANPSIDEALAIAKHLSEVDKMLTPLELTESWKSLPPEDRLSVVPPKAAISMRKGVLKVHWDWVARDIDSVPMEIVARRIIENRLPLAVVDLVEPCAGSSVSEAMRVRELLGQIGFGISDLMRTSHSETAIRVLGACLETTQLIEVISVAARIPLGRARLLVDLFTFHDARSELWFQPLVEVQKGRLSFALHPLCFASPIRTMEWLLSRDRKKEGEKGRAFEDGVYAFLQEAARLNKVVDVRVHRRLKTTNPIGDIDILIMFGATVLVVECKCPLMPTSENDFFNRESALRHASHQAIRKAEYISRDVVAFSARHELGMDRVDAVIPVVMVSGNEYVGASFEGCVPIVSKASISLALANRTDTLKRFDSDGVAQSIRESEAAESDPASAVRRLLRELEAPGMIELYRPFVVKDDAGYELGASQLSLEYFEVRFSDEKRQEFLQSLGV